MHTPTPSQVNKSLLTVALRANSIGPKGAEHIAHALKVRREYVTCVCVFL